MIEISFGKLVLLALIALIVLGPEKLPVAARTAGALLRRVRGSWDSVRAEVERELQVEEIRRTAKDVVSHMDAAQADLDATVRQVREVATPPSATATASATAAAAAAPDAVADATAITPAQPDTLTGDLFADPNEDGSSAQQERTNGHS